MICTATKGFLTQADCGAPAASACSTCGRPMCAAHLSPASGFSTCYGCAATQPQQTEGEQVEPEYDESWAHGYRSSYYSSTGYRPYDSSDTHSFNETASAEFEEDEHGAGGFDAS